MGASVPREACFRQARPRAQRGQGVSGIHVVHRHLMWPGVLDSRHAQRASAAMRRARRQRAGMTSPYNCAYATCRFLRRANSLA
jgi:hypothetical protein